MLQARIKLNYEVLATQVLFRKMQKSDEKHETQTLTCKNHLHHLQRYPQVVVRNYEKIPSQSAMGSELKATIHIMGP